MRDKFGHSLGLTPPPRSAILHNIHAITAPRPGDPPHRSPDTARWDTHFPECAYSGTPTLLVRPAPPR